MKKLHFGTAGIPLSSKKRDSAAGIQQVRKLGLGCMELEFVHGVRMSPEKALEVRKSAEKHNIKLTAHGPYYINLNSSPDVVKRSRQRIKKTAKIAEFCGAHSVTFHAAFYIKKDPEKVTETVKRELKNISEKVNVEIRPELTGKPTQWGNIDEIIKVCEIPGVSPCIDYAHFIARSGGKTNNYESFRELLTKIEENLGKPALKNMHIHIAGIEYSKKGEKRHRCISESDIRIKDIIRTWKEFDIKGVVISESPNIEDDALLVKRMYRNG